MAQMVERILGKDEVISSILISSSKKAAAQAAASLNCRHDGMADVTDSKSHSSIHGVPLKNPAFTAFFQVNKCIWF